MPWISTCSDIVLSAECCCLLLSAVVGVCVLAFVGRFVREKRPFVNNTAFRLPLLSVRCTYHYLPSNYYDTVEYS